MIGLWDDSAKVKALQNLNTYPTGVELSTCDDSSSFKILPSCCWISAVTPVSRNRRHLWTLHLMGRMILWAFTANQVSIKFIGLDPHVSYFEIAQYRMSRLSKAVHHNVIRCRQDRSRPNRF